MWELSHEGLDAMSDDLWHRPLSQIRGGELRGDTGQTSGMTRWEAISGKSTGAEKLWMGQTHVAPGARSGDHHHGEAETAIFVLSGPRRSSSPTGTVRSGWRPSRGTTSSCRRTCRTGRRIPALRRRW